MRRFGNTDLRVGGDEVLLSLAHIRPALEQRRGQAGWRQGWQRHAPQVALAQGQVELAGERAQLVFIGEALAQQIAQLHRGIGARRFGLIDIEVGGEPAPRLFARGE